MCKSMKEKCIYTTTNNNNNNYNINTNTNDNNNNSRSCITVIKFHVIFEVIGNTSEINCMYVPRQSSLINACVRECPEAVWT